MALMAGALIDVADFGDTGWVDCTLSDGVTEVGGHSVQVRRIGQIAFLRGRMERTAGTGQVTWATMPSGFEPDRIVEIPHRSTTDNTDAPARVYVTTNGEIQTQSTPAPSAVEINASWVVAE